MTEHRLRIELRFETELHNTNLWYPESRHKEQTDRTIVNAVCCEQLLGRNADPEGVWHDWVIHVVQKVRLLDWREGVSGLYI